MKKEKRLLSAKYQKKKKNGKSVTMRDQGKREKRDDCRNCKQQKKRSKPSKKIPSRVKLNLKQLDGRKTIFADIDR